MKKGIVLCLIFLCLLASFALAEPTQLYTKILVTPFYRDTLAQNVVYNYTLSVNPPDKITQVYSAIIYWQVNMIPTLGLTMKVNNQTCNTPTYNISTTYAGTSQVMASFDCSNIITKAGNYSVTLTASRATGAITGWLDLTYTNKPAGNLFLHGTEYQIGQTAKAWLQLLDTNLEYVNAGVCFLDIYTPDQQEYVEQALMLNMGHDGIYYYDLQVPPIEGVYPMIARCYYEATEVKYYATSINVTTGNTEWHFASDDLESNTFSGGTGWTGSWVEDKADRTDIVIGGNTYRLRVRDHSGTGGVTTATRYFDDSIFPSSVVSLSFTAQANTTNVTNHGCTYQYWNGTGWTTLLSLQGDTGATNHSFNVSQYGQSSNAGVRISTSTLTTTTEYCYIDNIVVMTTAVSNVSNLVSIDGNYTLFQEAHIGNVSRLNATINFNDTGNCSLVNPLLLTDLSIVANGKFDSVVGDDITISIWNYTSSTWKALPNVIPRGATFNTITNTIMTNNITASGLYNSSTGIRLKVSDTNLTDGNNSILYLDTLTIGCDQLSNSSWQEVKGSSEMHISPSLVTRPNQFVEITTCDGYSDGRCAIATNDAEFNWTEGELEDWMNFTAYVSRNGTNIIYSTPPSVDCTALYWIKQWNGTAWVDFTNYTTSSSLGNDNCEIDMLMDVNYAQNYEFWLKYDDYQKWEVDYTKNVADAYLTRLPDMCNDRNWSYVVPIVDGTNMSADPITLFCHHAYDDLWWISNYYNLSQSVTNAGEYSAYLSEMRFYRQEMYDRLNYLAQVTDYTLKQIYAHLDFLDNITQYNVSQLKAEHYNISAELVIQKGMIQSVLDYLTNTIYPYLTNIWNKLLGIETQLNTTINITTNINTTANLIKNDTTTIINKINDLNVSMTAGFAEKDAHIQSAYDNMTSQVNNLSLNVSSSFNSTWALIQALNTSQMGNNSLILSYLANITTTIANTQTQLSDMNQSLSQQISNTSNNTQALINNLNISNQARFDQLQSYLDNLTIQVSNNQNITQANITTLQNLMLSVNSSLTTDISNLNVSLYNVRGDLLIQLNQTYNYLVAMNLSLTNDLLLINTSLSGAIQTFRNEVQANFSSMFTTLAGISSDLNGTKAELLSGINNLSTQLTATNFSIQTKLDALNISMQAGFAEKDAHIQSAYDNITSQINNLSLIWSGNFSEVINRLDNLSTQVSSNHNITQSNLSAINTYLTNLNTSVQQGFTNLNSSIISQLNLVNASLSQSISDFRAESQANFTQVFFWLNSLNVSQTQANSKLDNLSIQLNSTRTDILNRIDLVNSTLTSDLQAIKNDTTTIIQLVNDLNLSLNNLNLSFTDTTALLLNVYGNLTNQLNANTTTILNKLIATNASLSADIANVKNDTQTTINLIGQLDAKTDSQYQNLTIFINNLDTQLSLNHNITQSNISTLFSMLTAMNQSETQDHLAINASLTQLGSDIYGYYVDLNNTITSKLDALNLSLAQELSALRNETSSNFNSSFLLLNQLSGELNSTKSELKSDISNLSIQLNDTRIELLQQMNYLNVSMQAGFTEKDAHIQSAYDNITSQINNLSITWDGNFTQVLNRLDNLSMQIDNNQNITQSNLSAINTYLINLNTSIQQGFTDLNTNLSLVQQNLSTQLSLVNQSLSTQIEALSNSTDSNFNLTFNWLEILDNNINGTRSEMLSSIQNLSLQLNDTRTEINNNLALVNSSLWTKMDEAENQTNYAIDLIENLTLIEQAENNSNQDVLDYLASLNTNITSNFESINNSFDHTDSLITNISQQINFTEVLSSLTNLSTQVSSNHNITQQNITQIFNKLDGLNDSCTQNFNSLNSSVSNLSTRVDNYMVWLNGTLVEMKSEISNTENMTIIINQSIVWIMEQLNVSTDDLNLIVTAPSKCLADTNWLARAQVKDRYGNILSYLDDVECNMTTDLWGTSNMSYSFSEANFKYIHVCDPTATIFNWSVNCGRT